MGMCVGLCTLGDENIGKVLADPPLIWKVIAPGDDEAYLQSRRRGSGFLSRLFGGKKTAVAPDVMFELAEGEVENADLDKAWHGIHYLLTGTASGGDAPLNFLLEGGAQVGNIYVGDGLASNGFTGDFSYGMMASDQRQRDVMQADSICPAEAIDRDFSCFTWWNNRRLHP